MHNLNSLVMRYETLRREQSSLISEREAALKASGEAKCSLGNVGSLYYGFPFLGSQWGVMPDTSAPAFDSFGDALEYCIARLYESNQSLAAEVKSLKRQLAEHSAALKAAPVESKRNTSARERVEG
jgi:hypothetical protein